MQRMAGESGGVLLEHEVLRVLKAYRPASGANIGARGTWMLIRDALANEMYPDEAQPYYGEAKRKFIEETNAP